MAQVRTPTADQVDARERLRAALEAVLDDPDPVAVLIVLRLLVHLDRLAAAGGHR